MKVSEMYPSRWLKAAELEDDGRTVTIKNVAIEEVGQKRERKPVMTFLDTDEKLVLNVTNCNAIADLTGNDDSDAWAGRQIKLVKVKAQYGANVVDAIRVEAPDKPAPAPGKLVRKSQTKRVADQLYGTAAEEDDGSEIPF